MLPGDLIFVIKVWGNRNEQTEPLTYLLFFTVCLPYLACVSHKATGFCLHLFTYEAQDLKQSQAPDNNFVSICWMDEWMNSSWLII